MQRYFEAIADIICRGFCWVLGSFLPTRDQGKLKNSKIASAFYCWRTYHLNFTSLLGLTKMKLMGITGPLLKLIQSFLNNILQGVVLNGQNSSWTPVFTDVPQGSVLGPPFFLVYINDLTESISSTTNFFCQWHITVFYC